MTVPETQESHEWKSVPARIKELRNIVEISALDMAKKINTPLETYAQYESGELDIPISMLYKIAVLLGTDVTVLLTGEDPRIGSASVCRAGKGIITERFPGYEYSSLAYNFKGRSMEPLLVYLDPAKEPSPPVTHSGQEFNYIVEGKIKISVGKKEYVLETGDAIYFNAELPHAQSAFDGPARFLTIIQE